MAKDIKMVKGNNTVTIAIENLEHFKKLGFKEEQKNVANKPEKIIKETNEKEL